MDHCSRNMRKLMELKGLSAAALTKKIESLGYTINQTSISNILSGLTKDKFGNEKEYDPSRSMENKVAHALGVERHQLISPHGFDETGRPGESVGLISMDDVEKASKKMLKYYLSISAPDDIDFDFFGRSCASIASAYSKGKEQADIALIKAFQSMPR